MNPAKLFHFHLRRWTWRPWSPPVELLEEITAQRWQIVTSAICSRCDWVRFNMTRRT